MDVEIRPGELRDLEELNEVYNHYVRTSAATFDIEPVTMDARLAWFERYGRTGPCRLLVAVAGDRFLGYADAHPHRSRRAYDTSVETTVYLAPEATGRALGTRLYGALLDVLTDEDLHRAVAGITVPNPASVALHERMGFRRIGLFTEIGRKFDRYWDVAWYEREL